MDKLERLLNLTAALLHTSRPLTAEEIRERVPGYPDGLSAFRRTFERDKDDLREMGVPLSIERIEGETPSFVRPGCALVAARITAVISTRWPRCSASLIPSLAGRT